MKRACCKKACALISRRIHSVVERWSLPGTGFCLFESDHQHDNRRGNRPPSFCSHRLLHGYPFVHLALFVVVIVHATQSQIQSACMAAIYTTIRYVYILNF